MSADTTLATVIKRANYTGANPFTYSQARDFPGRKVLNEFFPTSKYWSLLNNSNEVLVGTRGSGKTILLRMLCYSIYRSSPTVFGHSQRATHRFYGVYIPLRLQLLNEITTTDVSLMRKQFRFIFNCVAIGSYLDEIKVLVDDQIPDPLERLLATRNLINKLSILWGIKHGEDCSVIDELKAKVNRLFLNVRADWSALENETTFLRSGLLEPIFGAKELVNGILKIESATSTWIACFDEAEYLKPELQSVINTIIRSATEGVAIKIATLPLHWQTHATEAEGVSVQKDGDDFRFTDLDYKFDSEDFIDLTNNLVAVRLREIGVIEPELICSDSAFDDFLGKENDHDLIDIYKSKTKPHFVQSDFHKLISQELSERPKSGANRPTPGQIKRYAPIVILRHLRALAAQGNTKVAWLAGPTMARRVCGGNARRFIQMCYIFFQKAKENMLTENPQHEAVVRFSNQFCERAQSVHREGFVLQDLLNNLARYLEKEMHKGPLKDVGLGFTIAGPLLDKERLLQAIHAGIAYSYIVRPDEDAFSPITADSRLRLANAFGARHWLHMRAGAGTLISSMGKISSLEQIEQVLSASQAEQAMDSIQLKLFEGEKQ